MRANELAAYTVIMLCHHHEYLLLERSMAKDLWPGLWTGVGGRVESNEYGDLQTSALRELAEETGISGAEVAQLALRRVLFQRRPNTPFTVLLYYTGRIAERATPPCPEGKLAWVTSRELPGLALVGSSRLVLPLLMADCERDPSCLEPMRLGLATFAGDGEIDRIAWTDAD